MCTVSTGRREYLTSDSPYFVLVISGQFRYPRSLSALVCTLSSYRSSLPAPFAFEFIAFAQPAYFSPSLPPSIYHGPTLLSFISPFGLRFLIVDLRSPVVVRALPDRPPLCTRLCKLFSPCYIMARAAQHRPYHTHTYTIPHHTRIVSRISA